MPVAGRDGKTGQTYFKVVLASALKARNLLVDGWYSWYSLNILGNADGANLNSFTLFAVADTYLPSWIEPEKERREIRIRHTLDSLQVAKKLGCGSISIPPGGPLAGYSFCTFKLTERTGHGDLRTTRSVVDPKNSVLTNPCPLTPSTIMSMSFDSA